MDKTNKKQTTALYPEMIWCRCTKRQKDFLDERAKIYGIRSSEVIRRAINQGIEDCVNGIQGGKND